MPRPLKDELELRLALSKEDLYIKDIPRSDVISFSLPAVSIADHGGRGRANAAKVRSAAGGNHRAGEALD